MQDIRNNAKSGRVRARLGRRVLAFLCTSAVCAWIYLGGVGCTSVIDTLQTFTVTFSPQALSLVPGQSATATATLRWADEDRELDGSWSVAGDGIRVITAADCNPKTGVSSTKISVTAADRETLYGSAGVWTTSNGYSAELPVRVAFLDPLMAILLDSTKATRVRRASLPLTASQPRVDLEVSQCRVAPEDRAILKGQVVIRDASPGWVFSFNWPVAVEYKEPEALGGGWLGCDGNLPLTAGADNRSASFSGETDCSSGFIRVSCTIGIVGGSYLHGSRTFRMRSE